MKSKANIKSHPLHAILVPFPLAFFSGALIFDILSVLFNNIDFSTTAYFLSIAGIIGGLTAAIPGLIDFLYTIPPNSSAQKRGVKHSLVNTTAIILFLVSVVIRPENDYPSIMNFIFEGIGIICISFGGWMGGTLVYRNQIGVDPRYAYAGKWKELYLNPGEDSYQVSTVNELKVDQMMLIHLDGKRIVLAKTKEGYYAFDDHCTHKGGSLAGGALVCGTVQCPWHGSQFDVRTGEVKAGPATGNIGTYNVVVKEGQVFLVQ